MGYFWLNQRKQEKSNYSDVEGKAYHYRSNVPGSKQLSEGDLFIYYRPKEHTLFGGGVIDKIENHGQLEISNNPIAAKFHENVSENNILTEYIASIESYTEFEPPVSAREIKEKISFLKGRNGLSGVPQNSIHEINEDDYYKILEAADATDLLEKEPNRSQ